MKLQVIGWTHYNNLHFEEAENSFAAHAAIVADIKAHGYDFSGWHHQEADRGAPVLNDGKIRRYSQRGWGGLMADVYEDTDDPYAYSSYAFSFGRHGEDVTMPEEERDMMHTVYRWAAELLCEEDYDYLFEEDFSTRFPHPELGERGIYTLTEEEAEGTSIFSTVRQLPSIVMRRLAPGGLEETFSLDGYDCRLKGDRITLKMVPALELLEKGDTVILEGKSYLVTGVKQYKNITEDDEIGLMCTGERYEKAKEAFQKAEILIDIMI